MTGFKHTTANARFKERYQTIFSGGIIAAVLLHVLAFAYWPEMKAADYRYTPTELEAIDLPPEVEIPPPPEQIARPAVPVVASTVIDEEITIAPTTFEDNPVENLPPIPSRDESDLSLAPRFTPMTVRPELKNRAEVARFLVQHYPPLLRDAGISGVTVVWFYIDEGGRVQKTLVKESAGYEEFDKVALQVADRMSFSPALNQNERVAVWVAIPITFESR